MSPRDTGQNRFYNHLVTGSLLIAIALCLTLSLIFLSSSGLNLPPAAQADTETISVSYTPSFDTVYSISAPTTLTLSSSGDPTSMTISVQSWSDFPTNKSLYCNLSSATSLTSGSNSVDMIIKHDDAVVAAGDEIARFSPDSLASDTAAPFAVLTVEPSEKPTVLATYTGTITLEVGMVE